MEGRMRSLTTFSAASGRTSTPPTMQGACAARAHLKCCEIMGVLRLDLAGSVQCWPNATGASEDVWVRATPLRSGGASRLRNAVDTPYANQIATAWSYRETGRQLDAFPLQPLEIKGSFRASDLSKDRADTRIQSAIRLGLASLLAPVVRWHAKLFLRLSEQRCNRRTRQPKRIRDELVRVSKLGVREHLLFPWRESAIESELGIVLVR